MKRMEERSSPPVMLLLGSASVKHTRLHADTRREGCRCNSAVAGELQTLETANSDSSAGSTTSPRTVGDVVASCRRRQKHHAKAPAAQTTTQFMRSHAITQGHSKGEMSLLGQNLQSAKQDPSERSIGGGKQSTASGLYSRGRQLDDKKT